jgi:hypothetical protein
MSLLIALFITLIVVTLVTSGVSIMTYGKPIDDELVLEWVEKVKAKDGFESNSYDHSIIRGSIDGSFRNGKYFTNPPLPILFKYYIEDVGLVWRGSKASKALDQVREELGAGNKKDSHRRNLGL